MRNHLALVLIALVVAFSGCIFSPDDDVPVHPAPQNWQPEMWVTPDSVSVFFPNDWPDTTTFTWNVWGREAQEYVMDAAVRVSSFADFHIAFVLVSDGGATQHGTFSEMAAHAKGFFWSSDPTTGEILYRRYPFNEIHVVPGGVLVRLVRSIVPALYAVPGHPGNWPVTFQRSGRFEFRRATGRVQYRRDAAQLRARRVRGPLDVDDYVVMDVVLRSHYYEWMTPATVVVSSTEVIPFHWFFGEDLIERDMVWMYPQHDTHAAFSVARLRKLDASALSQLGYRLAESEASPVPGVVYLSVSSVGYNHARDEALIYGSYYCGGLCAEARLFLLKKVEGYWVIKNDVQLWIS
ncbi:MAG TPA: hypothetical protein VJS69_11400 [Candidatus Krumholzibacteria bacterium]|nr:hypothetical protein [Candidatus Krumholzibacteria bacterium]